jgi:hypothetical protein
MQNAALRFDRHVRHSNEGRKCAISAAIKKHGRETFSVEVLRQSNDSDELRRWEVEAIREFQTLSPNGYNLSSGGEKSEFWAPEVRDRAIASMKRSWVNPSNQRKEAARRNAASMKRACENEHVESARRVKISKTMKASGRHRGEHNGASKITAETAKLIKLAALTGELQQLIADRFGVSRRLVNFIANGKRWSHV